MSASGFSRAISPLFAWTVVAACASHRTADTIAPATDGRDSIPSAIEQCSTPSSPIPFEQEAIYETMKRKVPFDLEPEWRWYVAHYQGRPFLDEVARRYTLRRDVGVVVNAVGAMTVIAGIVTATVAKRRSDGEWTPTAVAGASLIGAGAALMVPGLTLTGVHERRLRAISRIHRERIEFFIAAPTVRGGGLGLSFRF